MMPFDPGPPITMRNVRSATPGPGPSTLRCRASSDHISKREGMRGRSRTLTDREEEKQQQQDQQRWRSYQEMERRQEPATQPISTVSSTGSATQTGSPTLTSSSVDLFPAPTLSNATSSIPLFSNGTSLASVPSNTISSPLPTAPVTSPLTTTSSGYTPTSSSTYDPGPTLKVYVPAAGKPLEQGENGLLMNMTLGGDDVGEASYSIPVVLGHASSSASTVKRAGVYQTLKMQLDLGSSDMWVAASTCTTSSCQGSGVVKYNAAMAIDSGIYANLTFHQGAISGSIYWDEVQVGVTAEQIATSVNGTGGGGSNGFDIAYQAFIAADQISDEDLNGAEFDGIVGLALSANSVIGSIIPGTTTGNPDGATFLDNLFGSGVGAPIGRYFTMSLERRGDTRTKSSFGLGMFDKDVCTGVCLPNYNSIVTSPNGPLHWRILLQEITVAVWPSSSDPASGGVTYQTIQMPSSGTTGQSFPVAVLDSGGSQILFGSRQFLDSVYSVYGISASSDGNYYMSCTQIIGIAFTFNGQQYPVHPIDMSDYTTGSSKCLGSMQYAAGLTAGDVILGSSFLKNVYSVYTYPSSSVRTRSTPPLVGLVSLTNGTQAAQEFYSVRNQHNPLTPDSTGSSPPSPNNSAEVASGKHVASGGIIALGVVLGFVALAGGLFCAWFFWLRHKYGRNGVVLPASGKGGAEEEEESMDVVTKARRQKKLKSMQRQKSMIDGYSDFDVDSWAEGDGDSKTDTIGSFRSRDYDDPATGEVPVLHRDDDAMQGSPRGSARTGESTRQSNARISAWESSYPPTGWSMSDSKSSGIASVAGGKRESGSSPARSSRSSYARNGSGGGTHDRSLSIATTGSFPGSPLVGSGRYLDATDETEEHEMLARPSSIPLPARPREASLSLSHSQSGSVLSPTRENLLAGLGEVDSFDTSDRYGNGRRGRTEYAQGSIRGIVDPFKGLNDEPRRV